MATPLATRESAALRDPFAPPRAAYIHVPFCRHRCGYCNFTLVAGRDDLVADYLRAVETELAECGSPREVATLYFGGGTPTYLNAAQFQQLAASALRWHPLADGYEWTVEANPLDIDPRSIEQLAACGVNRLSLGGQSFNARKLALLERDHNATHVVRAVELARCAGMQVSLDLIFAAAGETLIEWADDLDRAVAFQPDHVSTYGLTYEKGARFWTRRLRGELIEIDESLEREMYALAIERLTSAGFEHYEISNFAKPGRRSRHNEAYWSGAGYFAAGPGAARYVRGIRELNHRSTTTYIRRVLRGKSPVAEREQLSAEARARELLVFGLRRLEGVSRHEFAHATGFAIDELGAEPLRKYIALGLLEDDGNRVSLSREGLFVSDALWPDFV